MLSYKFINKIKYFKYLIISLSVFLILDSLIQLNPKIKDIFHAKSAPQKENLSCTNNHKLTYFIDSEISKKIAENSINIKYLFEYGDSLCRIKNSCLREIVVYKDGTVEFNCLFYK